MKLNRIIPAIAASLLLGLGLAGLPAMAAAPSIGSVAITPDPAYTDTDLTAVPSDDWSDADGDEPAFEFQWQKWDDTGSVWMDIVDATQDTLAFTEFGIGDQIKIICTPFDGTEYGASVEDEITISGGIVTITPNPGYIDTDLTATPEHWAETAESFPEFSYQWQKWDEAATDWADIGGETTETLAYANFSQGDLVRAVCSPTGGDPVYAEVTISGGIVEISPDPAYTDTDLTANPLHWAVDELDIPEFTYQWQIWDETGGDWADIAGETGPMLANSFFVKGDQLQVLCTPVVEGAEPVADSIVISNSPPQVAVVSISPDPAATDSLLEAVPEGWQDADGDEEGYLWQWQKWDETSSAWTDIEAATSQTLDNSNFSMGDELKVICTPFDGTDSGDSVEATVSISVLSYDEGVDVKPGSDENPINLKSRGVIPVAVYTTEGFDATLVDPETVVFGPGETPAEHWAFEDVDGDGTTDLILHFRTQAAGISPDDVEVTLSGQTTSGMNFTGTNTIKIVPSAENPGHNSNVENGSDFAPGQVKATGEPAEGKGKAAAPGLNKQAGQSATGKAVGKNK